MKLLKNTILLFFMSISILCISQERETSIFMRPFPAELHMTKFENDTTASGVVLFEQGNYSFKFIDNQLTLIKDVYRKMKVLDAKRFNYANIEIPYFVSKDQQEKVSRLKALTHNGNMKIYVNHDDVFNIYEGGDFAYIRFAFPKIQNGSVIEYVYRIESPFFFNFEGWQFQGDLPKLYSEFISEIPGNLVYNRSLYGSQKLYVEKASVANNCFKLPGGYGSAQCEVAIYAMKDIPAYKDENFMLSKKNYISKADYELMRFMPFGEGKTLEFSEEWSDVDKNFRKEKDIGKQLRYSSFFKNKIPEDILSISNPMDKAKAIYTFIRNELTWNGTFFTDKTRPKNAFEKKTGSIAEINLALINALDGAGFDVKLILLSSRNNGQPALRYPIMTDFDYLMATLTIEDEKILLDATDKFTPFGIVPFRALNQQGRVMDFKNGSYWHPIKPYSRNIQYTNIEVRAEENERFTGTINEIFSGYIGIEKKTLIGEKTIEVFKRELENIDENIEIQNLVISNENNGDEPLKFNYNIALDTETVEDKVYFHPFFLETYFKTNPFNAETRVHPIDLGFPITNTFLISIDLNDKYAIEYLPDNKILTLEEDAGKCSVIYTQEGNQIKIRLHVELKTYHFSTEYYASIKDFFAALINIQVKDLIVLKRL